MNRARNPLATLALLLAGGLLLGAAPGHASGGDDPALEADDRGADADADAIRRAPGRRTADAHRVPPAPPAPPAPPPPGGWGGPPLPPLPPVPPGGRRGGHISVSIHDGKIQIRGVEDFTRSQLEAAGRMIRSQPDLPPDVRDRVLAQLDRTRAMLDRRLKSMSVTDLDQLGDELEKLGEDLERSMSGLESELGKLGKGMARDVARQVRKELAKNLRPGKIHIDRDDSDSDADEPADTADAPDDADDAPLATADADDAVTPGALAALRGFSLSPAQRDQIARLSAASAQEIARARKALADASQRLSRALADPSAADADIARYVDQVSAQEAAIRKARLLTWVGARRLLDEGQRKQLEHAHPPRVR